MREILFRGKRVDNGEWVYGFYIKATHHWHDYGIHEDWIATDAVQNGGWCNIHGKHAVIPETVGQYTGLTDKNGKKIFEGDIVEYMGLWGGNWDVCFSADRCGWYPFACGDGRGCCESINVKEPNNGVVIGNIHDSPELLEGGE